jgi:hypothetical protein
VSLFAVSGGALWEAPPEQQPQPRCDPERPFGALVPVAGREDEAARGAALLSELWRLTHDEQAQKDAVRALIRAGIVEVVR